MHLLIWSSKTPLAAAACRQRFGHLVALTSINHPTVDNSFFGVHKHRSTKPFFFTIKREDISFPEDKTLAWDAEGHIHINDIINSDERKKEMMEILAV